MHYPDHHSLLSPLSCCCVSVKLNCNSTASVCLHVIGQPELLRLATFLAQNLLGTSSARSQAWPEQEALVHPTQKQKHLDTFSMGATGHILLLGPNFLDEPLNTERD